LRGDAVTVYGEGNGSLGQRARRVSSGLEVRLGFGTGLPRFHPTVLVYFRDRLEHNKAERVIFDAIVKMLVDLGLMKRKGKQRLDSTPILGYVKEMSRLECAVATLRLGLEAIAKQRAVGNGPSFGSGCGRCMRRASSIGG
jgi:hypothetical protein